jgi:hypothetical protein
LSISDGGGVGVADEAGENGGKGGADVTEAAGADRGASPASKRSLHAWFCDAQLAS